MPTATLTTVTLEAIGKPKASKYEGKPPYRPCLFVLPDGTQKWKSYNEGAPELDWLLKGGTYQAAIAADGEMTLLQPGDTPLQPPPQPAAAAGGPTIPDDRKREIASYISDLAPLYGYCYQQATQQLEPHGARAEAIEAAASALFDAACRRFQL